MGLQVRRQRGPRLGGAARSGAAEIPACGVDVEHMLAGPGPGRVHARRALEGAYVAAHR